MAAAKRAKANLEFLLVKAKIKGMPEKGLLIEAATSDRLTCSLAKGFKLFGLAI